MSDALIAPRGIVRLTEDWPGRYATAKVGDLVRRCTHKRGMIWSNLANGGMHEHESRLVFEDNPPLTWKDFPALMHYYLSGHDRLPNLKSADTERTLNTIACGGNLAVWPSVATVKLPDNRSGWGTWARVFMSYTQGNQMAGNGYLIAYKSMSSQPDKFHRCWTFALCDHAFKAGAGGNPSRGWNPGYCTRCGLDMSVDSGD